MAQPEALSQDRLNEAGIGAFFRPSQVEDLGIAYDDLRRLVRQGVVEHVGRGLYRLAAAEPTEHYSIASVCARVPKAIVCLVSALSVHDIGTRVPSQVWIAIPHKAEPPRVFGVRIRLLRFSGAALRNGIESTAFEGVPARITSPARTVLDCFRFERLVGREAALEALYDSLQRGIVTVDELGRAGEVLPSRRLRAALESLPP